MDIEPSVVHTSHMSISPGDEPRYPSPMTTPDPRTNVRAMLQSIGVNVTDEGIARARQRRLEAKAKHTPELRAAWREQLGLPAEPA